MKKILTIILTAIFFIISFYQCKDSSTNSNNNDNTDKNFTEKVTIDSKGGKYEVTNENSPLLGAYIDIPGNALDKSTEITIKEPDNKYTFETDSIGIFLDLEPNGIEFNKPIKIGIPYSSDNLNSPSGFYFNEADRIWKELPIVSIDNENKILTVETNHFTVFTANKSNVAFSADLYKKDETTIAVNLSLITPLSNISTDLATYLATGAANIKELIEVLPFDVRLYYSVTLKQKIDFWFDKKIGEYSQVWGINKEYAGSPNRYEVRCINQYGNISYETKENYLRIEEIESYLSARPVLFPIESSALDFLKEYYIEVAMYFIDSYDWICCNGKLYGGQGYSASTYSFASIVDKNSITIDEDQDNIINEFDLQNENIPVASFTINPSSGNTSTVFTFDASGCTDNEDPISELQVRWDWENDGSWDTGYSTAKQITHQFNTEGTKTIKLEVKDTDGFVSTTSKQISISTSNSAPTASFTINPSSGNTSTVFTFDASGCTDNEDPISELQVRWDWENDGSWDTGYSTTKTASHQYSTVGTKTINLEVKDTDGLTSTATNQVIVSDGGDYETGTVTDIDGNIYQTVKIGDQWWMAENLKVTKYRNGDYIQHIINNSEWSLTTSGAYSVYNNNDNNINDYGLLYNWQATNDGRNIAPEGWRVPSSGDFQDLADYLGGSSKSGSKLKEQGTMYWLSPNSDATNETGFTAMPGGYRHGDGFFSEKGSRAYLWTTSNSDEYNAWGRTLYYNISNFGWYGYDKLRGFSIRCIKGEILSNTNPIASFTVNPISGTTDTIFNFDASGCTDNEDDVSALHVRWDWDNNGVWDTGYTTQKTASYQYSTEGVKTIKLEVKDAGGLTAIATKQVLVANGNSVPIASFTVTPSSGSITTNFTFDASACSDNEDSESALHVRWDWENDGSWDTDYSTIKIATHQYDTEGTKTIKLEVKDTDDLTSSLTQQILVNEYIPFLIFYVNPQIGDISTTFEFDAGYSEVEEIRWDWEDDGIWDTDFSSIFTSTHKYSEGGTYTVRLEGKDYTGLLVQVTKIVKVTGNITTPSEVTWVYISKGDYTWGENAETREIDYEYYISTYEITNEQYLLYLEEALNSSEIVVNSNMVSGNYEGDERLPSGIYDYLDFDYSHIYFDNGEFKIDNGFEQHPVIVTWFGAYAYTKHNNWLLPNEYEWEKAARGNTGYNFTWGSNILDGRRANYFSSGDPYDNGTTPVGYYNGENHTLDSPSPFGAYDMVGNVSEWTNSFYFESTYESARVLKGNSCNTNDNDPTYSYLWQRYAGDPNSINYHYSGFRVLKK